MSQTSRFPDPYRLPPKPAEVLAPPSLHRRERPWLFPVTVSLILLAMLAVAWFTQGSAAAPSLPPIPGPGAVADPGPAPPATSPSPSPSTADDLKAIRGEIGLIAGQMDDFKKRLDLVGSTPPKFDLRPLSAEIEDSKARFDALTKRVDSMSESPARLDLKPLQARLDDLARLNASVADLQKKIDGLSRRVASSDEATGEIKAEVALRPAAILFQQRRYGPSLEILRKLQESNPQDARVWYYSALANGLGTNKWDGETQSWVNEGVVREQAGTPDRARIDAEFIGLIKATGKEWLDYHRKQVNP